MTCVMAVPGGRAQPWPDRREYLAPIRTGGEKTMFKQALPALAIALFPLTPALADETDIGARLYQESCSGCHGASGKSGGELSQLLNIETPALTGLAAANDGVFPMLDVIQIIDGRTGVRAHGGPMPVFGSLYSASSVTGGTDYGSVVEVRGRILSLAMYLQSIQE
jgi:mono/diheme cytochrome c family protein